MSLPTPGDCHDGQQRRLQRALRYLCDRLTDDDEHTEINNLQRQGMATNAVTFELIKTKIDDFQYETTDDFFQDILSMNSTMKDSSIRLKKNSKKMVDYCRQELSFINACDSCYVLANTNDSQWFSYACERLHSLVWAKVIGYPYEPAKLLKLHDKVATVHFFGDHSISETQTKLCLRFSKESPNKNYISKVNVLREVNEYIKNIGPSFEYAQFGERLTDNVRKYSVTPRKRAATVASAHLCATATITSSLTVTPVTTTTWTSAIRKNIDDLLDQNEKEFETLKADFKLKEAVYQSEIKQLEEKLSSQKSQFDRQLKEAKNKKYCDCCSSSTNTTIKIFCSNSCGAKWYGEQPNV